MKQSWHCIRIAISFYVLFGIQHTLFSQNITLFETKIIDSLIAQKDYKKADSVLVNNIEQLKQKQYFLEMTKRIYYVGKIALKLNGKDHAIKKTNAYANSITNLTDSLSVSRQKHLVLARFYVFLRDYKSASEQNLLALEETKKMPNATGDLFGLIHHNLSIDNRRTGNLKQAIWHSKKSLEYYLSYPESDKNYVLDAYNSLGARMWDAFKIDSALFYFKKGEKIIDELEPTPHNKYYHKAKMQSNISSVYSILGKSSDAANYNEKAIRNYSNFIESDGDGKDFFKEEARMFQFLTIENYAADFSKQGNYKKAKELNIYVYNQKLKYLPKGDTEIAYSCIKLGNIHLKLKDYKVAEEFFNKGLEIYTNHEQKDYIGIAEANYYIGVVHEYNNNIEAAKYSYEKSKGYYENVFGNNYDEGYLNAMQTYSNFYSKNGFTDKAIKMATETYNYVIKNQGETTNTEYYQLVNLANIYYDSKNYSEASLHIDKALKTLENSSAAKGSQLNALHTSFKKPMALLLKSKIELQLKSKRDSIFLKKQYSKLQEAIAILEKQKTIITEDQNVSIILDNNDEVFEFSKHIALLLYKETNNSKYLREILGIHESKLYNKIRQQLNVQSNFSSDHIPQSVLQQEKQLKESLNSALSVDDGLETFMKANTDWTSFLETLKRNHPKYYKLRYASISKSLNTINLNFPENTTVIRYVFIEDQLYAFVIEKNNINVYDLDSKLLENVFETKNRESTILEDHLNSNNKLHNVLWQPFAEDVSYDNIIIVPDGKLFNLSFEVLSSKKLDSFESLANNCLLNQYNISYNYSLLLIDKNRTPKFFKDNFIAFTPEFNDQMKSNYKTAITDSVFLDKTYLSLLPQPFSKDLAQYSSKLFDGKSFVNEKASKQLFTSQAKEHKIIHIGTHAESNNVSPELSRLIFAKNVNDTIFSEDNSLYTYEIYNQNLSSNLAILTACETGKPTFQAGEGMISLAHAFNYAGSESILTSLWKIDEQSSTKIIEYFYENLKDGLPKDEALKNAKLEYIATAKGRTMGPEYWAGLVLIGDTSAIELKSSSNLIFWLVIAAIIFILIGVVARKKRIT